MMNNEERMQLELKITEIMRKGISSDYVSYILYSKSESEENTFLENIIQDILENSAWEEEGYYNEDDIRLAIGRELMDRLGIEV